MKNLIVRIVVYSVCAACGLVAGMCCKLNDDGADTLSYVAEDPEIIVESSSDEIADPLSEFTGSAALDLKIPQFDVDGNIVSEIQAERATYNKGRPVQMQGVKIIEFQENNIVRVTTADTGDVVPSRGDDGTLKCESVQLSGNVKITSFGSE